MQSEYTKITDCHVTSWTVNGKTNEQNLRDYIDLTLEIL